MKRKILILMIIVLSFSGASFAQGEIIRPKDKYEGQGLSDPFKDPFKEPPTPEELAVSKVKEVPKEPDKPLPAMKVSGVIIGNVVNQAIVNDKIVKVGDSIEGATITSIDKKGMTVFFNNKNYNVSSPAVDMAQAKTKNPKGGQK